LKRKPTAPSTRPYRDSALIYAAFATLFVLIVFATGGALLPRFHPRTDGWPHFVVGALPLAVGLFLLATAYSWWRVRQRLDAKGRDS
jgi:polyferredoxin